MDLCLWTFLKNVLALLAWKHCSKSPQWTAKGCTSKVKLFRANPRREIWKSVWAVKLPVKHGKVRQSLSRSSTAVPDWWGQHIQNLNNLHTHTTCTEFCLTGGSTDFVPGFPLYKMCLSSSTRLRNSCALHNRNLISKFFFFFHIIDTVLFLLLNFCNSLVCHFGCGDLQLLWRRKLYGKTLGSLFWTNNWKRFAGAIRMCYYVEKKQQKTACMF